jgi:hypothetical protein
MLDVAHDLEQRVDSLPQEPLPKVVAIHEMQAAGKKVAHIARVTALRRPTIYRVLRQGECVVG